MNVPHTHSARLAAALPPQAALYLSQYIDPADAFIAFCDGLTVKQAHSRARNLARRFGSSWPDRLPARAECLDLPAVWAADPAAILEAREALEEALDNPNCLMEFAQADAREISTRELATASGITQRRARQIKSLRVARAAVQMVLFAGDEEGDDE